MYADDLIILAKSQEELQNKMNVLTTFLQEELQKEINVLTTFLQEELQKEMNVLTTFLQEELQKEINVLTTFLQEELQKEMNVLTTFLQEELQNKMNALTTFSQERKLFVMEQKSMVFNRGNKPCKTKLTINRIEIESVKTFKYLGFTVGAEHCSFNGTCNDLRGLFMH